MNNFQAIDRYSKKILEYDYRIALSQFLRIEQFTKGNQEILYNNLLYALETIYTRTWNLPDD